MALFLSTAWLAELDSALSRSGALTGVADDVRVSVRQRVSGTPSGDVDFVVRIADGRATVVAGAGPSGAGPGTPDPGQPADAEVLATWPVAKAISQGTLAPTAAFGAGRLRLGGDVGLLVRHTEILAALARATASLGPTTTY